MGYVLAEIWPLLLVALALGVALGWWCKRCFTRAVDAEHQEALEGRDRELAELRSRTADLEVAAEDLQTARARIVHLEGRTAEMDELRARLADVFRTRVVSLDREASDLRARLKELQDDTRPRVDQQELDGLREAGRQRDVLRRRVAELEGEQRRADAAPAEAERKLAQATGELETLTVRHREQVAMLAAARQEADALRQRLADVERAVGQFGAAPRAAQLSMAGESAPVLDLAAAREVIGKRVRMDDLLLVEGIGPKIAELCREAGVTTWRGLGDTPVPVLQGILDAAGPRYRMHDPSTWPRQAQLLAEGRWEAFRDLVAHLRGGRAV